MRIGIVLPSKADYQDSNALTGHLAYFFLGQTLEILKRFKQNGISFEVEILNTLGNPIREWTDDTPMKYFHEMFVQEIGDEICFRDGRPKDGDLDVIVVALLNGIKFVDGFYWLLNIAKHVIYFESDGELFRHTGGLNWIAQNFILDPFWKSVRDKTTIVTTIFHPDYRRIIAEQTGFDQMYYAPTVPLDNFPSVSMKKTQSILNIRTWREGCLARLAKFLKVKSIVDKTISSSRYFSMSKLNILISEGEFIFPGSGCHNPALPFGFRLVAKTWEGYLADTLYLFPVIDFNFFHKLFPDYPREFTIPLFMHRDSYGKWKEGFESVRASLSYDDRIRLLNEQAKHNLPDSPFVKPVFDRLADKLMERLNA